MNINDLDPNNSRIARLRAAKRQRQAVKDAVAGPLSQIEEGE